MRASTAIHHSTGTTHWRLAIQKRNDTAYLYFLELSLCDSGPTALAKLRAEYDRLAKKTTHNICGKSGVFWQPVVEVALLSEV